MRNRFEEEISTFVPDLKESFHQEIEQLMKDKRRLQGALNNLVGKFAELQLVGEFRARKRFALSIYFAGVKDRSELNIINVKHRQTFQRPDGKEMEIDVLAESSCGRVVLVEVKKRQTKTALKAVEDFQEKVAVYGEQFPDKIILPAFLSLGGFMAEAKQFCETQGIGLAERIKWRIGE